MMTINASNVKKLREVTGAGMMKCKEALVNSDGDFQKAVEFLRKKGLAEAQRRESRIATEGAIVTSVQGNRGVILEVNCETDFVAKGADFSALGENLAKGALAKGPIAIEALRESEEELINEFALKCGEKIHLRRFTLVQTDGHIGSYNHQGKMGVLVETDSGDAPLLKDLSMHIAAMNPLFISEDQIDDNFRNKETEIYTAQLREEKKDEKIIPNIVRGKLKKMVKDICLVNQVFFKDSKQTVGQFLGGVKVKEFIVYRLGEGIEKKSPDLAAEVAQMTK